MATFTPHYTDRTRGRSRIGASLFIGMVLLLLMTASANARGLIEGATPSGTPAGASPVATPQAIDPDVPVLAYYYIWFNPNSWDRAKTDFPLLGRYSSDDAVVMRQHVQWAKSVGIDGFIVSWKNTNILTERLRLLIEISKQEDFKLVIIYQGLDVDREPLPAARVAADLDFFTEEFADDPVFDLFAKPVVIWSGTWKFSRDEIASVTASRRERLMILASERNSNDYRNLADLFDGDAYYWSSVNPDTYPEYLQKLQSMAQAVHEHDGLWISRLRPVSMRVCWVVKLS